MIINFMYMPGTVIFINGKRMCGVVHDSLAKTQEKSLFPKRTCDFVYLASESRVDLD